MKMSTKIIINKKQELIKGIKSVKKLTKERIIYKNSKYLYTKLRQM